MPCDQPKTDLPVLGDSVIDQFADIVWATERRGHK
jgi:hypothetical protein